MKLTATLAVLILVSVAAACAGPRSALSPAAVDSATLTSADGAPSSFKELAAKAPLTVVVFISAECPCLEAHLARLHALSTTYAPRGVKFVAVDSEVGASPARAASEAAKLGLPFPVMVDPGAKLADAVGAEYATFTVVVDREARVRYGGGIDTDKRKLHPDATPYVAEALDDLLAGHPPRRTEGKALGCSLRKW
jgi:peroxiredoxin